MLLMHMLSHLLRVHPLRLLKPLGVLHPLRSSHLHLIFLLLPLVLLHLLMLLLVLMLRRLLLLLVGVLLLEGCAVSGGRVRDLLLLLLWWIHSTHPSLLHSSHCPLRCRDGIAFLVIHQHGNGSGHARGKHLTGRRGTHCGGSGLDLSHTILGRLCQCHLLLLDRLSLRRRRRRLRLLCLLHFNAIATGFFLSLFFRSRRRRSLLLDGSDSGGDSLV
mmetsp:Transcript_17467/g.31600  ORF Transcript_17467/g.31600 Transcript_17467/m.31600 type:complete len:217 (-) Transcript_17467:720-1370(-)